MLFAWDDWNTGHVARHDLTAAEAEFVVRYAQPPWPEQKGDDKLAAWGATSAGRLLQVVFSLKFPDEIEFTALSIGEWADLRPSAQLAYVVHAMELTAAMKHRYRRRRSRP